MGIANVVDADLDVLTELNLGYVRSVHARTTFTHADGSDGVSRNMDIWQKRGGW